MKIKGISFFEQHVEKFVLLGALAIAVGFAAMQFLVAGNTVEIDGREYTAAEVDEALETKARDIQARLSDDADATVQPPSSPRTPERVAEGLHGSVVPPDSMIAALPATPPNIRDYEVAEINMFFVEPTLVATEKPWVEQYADALESREDLPEDVVANVQFGSPGTNDVAWTTPTAWVDLDALREQLAAADPNGERLAISPNWYDNRLYVLDVVFERETLMPNGSWGEHVIVPTMPEFVEHRAHVDAKPTTFTRSHMRNVLDWLRESPGFNQAAIIQPEFYPTKSSLWLAPQEPTEIDENDPSVIQIMDMQSRLSGYESRLAALMEELEALGGPLEEEERDRDRDRDRGGDSGRGSGGGPGIPGGGGGAGAPGGGGSGMGVEEDRERRAEKSNEERRRRLTREMYKLQSRISQLRPELESLAAEHGFQLEEDTGERPIPNLATDPSVLVWGHDLTVERGKTYRYRATVRLYNPFFGKTTFLRDEQKHLADVAAMDVQPSEWSDPVAIKSFTRFFVTGARADDPRLGMGKATVEVFRLFDGKWYRGEFDLYPGDPVGQIRTANGTEVDFFADAYVQDILRTPGDSGPVGGSDGKVVIVRSDGVAEVRNPARDASASERLRLMTLAETERTADAR